LAVFSLQSTVGSLQLAVFSPQFSVHSAEKQEICDFVVFRARSTEGRHPQSTVFSPQLAVFSWQSSVHRLDSYQLFYNAL